MKKLYFVEEIIKFETNNLDKYQVVLMDENSENNNVMFVTIETDSISLDNNKEMYEGQYVYYNDEVFSNGNTASFARSQNTRNGILRKQLLTHNLQQENKDVTELTNVTDVYSYHVNVGHGNCTILVFKESDQVNIWMIDCSIRERSRSTSYEKRLDDLIVFIEKNHLDNDRFFINKFFLTHPHFDHISGIDYIIQKSYLTSQTTCYINLRLASGTKYYNQILSSLKQLSVKFVEPIASNSNKAIKILHPKSSLSNKKGKGIIYEREMNSTSVVIRIELGGKTILLLGDLEQNGWERLIATYTTQLDQIFAVDFYCISHHASLNGHPPKLTTGVVNKCKKAILMGRNGAYSGIYSPQVLKYFHHNIAMIEFPQNNSFYQFQWSDYKQTHY